MTNKLTTFANKGLGMEEKTIKEALLKGERITLECKRAKSEVQKELWKILKGVDSDEKWDMSELRKAYTEHAPAKAV